MQTPLEPVSGFTYLLRGFAWLPKKGIKRFVFIPLLINIVLFGGLFYLSGHLYSGFIHWIDSKLPDWLQWLNWILWPLFVGAAAIFLTYTFTLLANLVGAPFNAFLAEKVELIATGKKPNDDEGIWDAVKDMPRALKRQLQIIGYFIPRVIVILLLFLIPGINIIVSIIWFIFSGWTLAMQYLDYPMDNHKIDFESMKCQMKKTRWRTLGFGCTVMLATLIPIVNFIVMPAAVIGATLMFVDQSA